MVGRIETEGVGRSNLCARNSDDSTGRAVGVSECFCFIDDKGTCSFCFTVKHLHTDTCVSFLKLYTHVTPVRTVQLKTKELRIFCDNK